jgi:histidinol phosphatase-like PHP family hydrolase
LQIVSDVDCQPTAQDIEEAAEIADDFGPSIRARTSASECGKKLPYLAEGILNLVRSSYQFTIATMNLTKWLPRSDPDR